MALPWIGVGRNLGNRVEFGNAFVAYGHDVQPIPDPNLLGKKGYGESGHVEHGVNGAGLEHGQGIIRAHGQGLGRFDTRNLKKELGSEIGARTFLVHGHPPVFQVIKRRNFGFTQQMDLFVVQGENHFGLSCNTL